jgi:transposase-like protein
MSGQGQNIRYSLAFKQKVITEIEDGIYSISEASRVYKVSTKSIYKWLKEFSKDHLINRIVRIEMRDEADRIKELEEEKRKLESALAQAQLKIITLESTIESAEELYKVDFKKKSGTKVSDSASRK